MNAKEYIEKFYKIRTKKGDIVNLKLNNAQSEFYCLIKKNYGKKPGRYIVLKARQLGISTFTEGLIFYYTTNQFNTNSIIIAHTTDASSSIFEMMKLYYDELPEPLKPKRKYSNAKMLAFDSDTGKGLRSSIRVGVANDSTRGQTYRYAHLSELAFWQHPDIAMLSLMQTIPNENDTVAVIESTANGFNYFYQMWDDAVNGRNDFIPVFFPWYLDPNYSKPYTGFELSAYELDIKKRFNLSYDQLEWRRWCIKNNCNNDVSLFRQEYPITPEEAFIMSGDSVFDTEIILNRLKDIPSPMKKGYFKYDYDGLKISNIQWVNDESGFIEIYEEPTDDYTALGGDTAGEGEDFFACHVLNRQGKQIAVLHNQFDEDLFTKQVYCLGKYYNSVISIEANFSTYPNMELQRLGYDKLYIRNKFDNIQKGYEKKFGFKTTSLTRPIIISSLVEIVREHIENIVDRKTLNEMLSFVRIKGKPQASEGTHDDLVMALAIAYDCLSQLPTTIQQEEIEDEDETFYSYGG